MTPGPSPTTTPTEKPIASITPAVPLVLSSRYQLVNWSIQDAARLVKLLEAYPDANFKNKESASYFSAFRYALYAEQEALLRYPDSPQARLWRWDEAYNLARTGDERAGIAYGTLIQTALNGKQVIPENLNSWFFNIEPRMALRPVELEPIPGSNLTMLLALERSGSAFLLLVEVGGEYQVYPLATRFNFSNPQEYDFSIADFTGDGNMELVLYQVSASTEHEPNFPLVYSLSSFPLQQLPFNPAESFKLRINHDRIWISEPNELGRNDLVVQTRVFPACPLIVTARFRWNGFRFDFLSRSYQFELDPNLLPFCEATIDHAAANWGAPAALEILGQLINVSQDSGISNLPVDLMDKWRFQLGLNEALVGNFASATAQMEALQQNPFDPEGLWSRWADDFLTAYRSPEEIYQACTTSDLCSDQQALAARIQLFSVDEYDLIIDQLGRENLPIRASGFYDFEGDNNPERWFTFRHPGRLFLDLWILSQSPTGIIPLYVDQVDTSVPEFEAIEDSGSPPGIRLFYQKSFTLARLLDSGEPYLAPYEATTIFTVDRIRDTWEAARDGLLAGANPAIIQQDLLELKAGENFICPYATCQDFIFTLALASELSGDSTLAIENYHRLWLDYRDSPFTISARLKLIGESFVPTATPTPTRTPRPSRTPTSTPEESPTPEATATP